MRLHRYITLLLVALLMLTACKGGKGQKNARINKTDKQPVMVEELAPRTLQEYITVSGKLEGETDITMTSETSGRLLTLYKKLGDSIKQGEKIGQIDNEVYALRLQQAQAAANSAQSAFDTAQLNLNTSQTLFQRNTISQAEYNNAQAAYKGAKANLDGANAGLESARKAYDSSFLTSPATGVITNLIVAAGQYINIGMPVATITNDSALLIKTGIGESQIGKIRKGQSADVYAPGNDTPVPAYVRAFGIRPLLTGANYPIEIMLRGKDGLLPGMVVTARILSGTYPNMLYTSINNIVKVFDRNYVFVVDDKGIAHRREVKLGRMIGENVVIESGLNVGDKIVTSGMENLEDSTKVDIRS